MEKFFDKLSSYNLLNNLLPGAAFCYLLSLFYNVNLLFDDTVANLIFFYFCGMVISRIGSVIIEPFLRLLKFVRFADYSFFIKACSKDTKLDILSETNNTYRSFVALFFLTSVFGVYLVITQYCLDVRVPLFISVALLALFLFSYRKQVSYIRKRVEQICKDAK